MKIVILDPYFETLGGGEKVVVVMAEHLAKQNEVIILVKNPIDKKSVEKYFKVGLQAVEIKLLAKEPLWLRALTSRYVKLPGRWKSLIYDRDSLSSLKKIGADLFINNLYQSNLPSPAAKSIYMCMFPQKLTPKDIYHSSLRQFYNQLTTKLETKLMGSRQQAINSYNIVVANSNYTAGWIKKYWQRNSEVVYPVCDNMGPPLKKQKIILNVGRFFKDNGTSHHKRQDTLIQAFKQLGRTDWQLHLAGSITNDSDSENYLTQLKDLAKDNPNIFIHPNMSFNDLKKLRQQASIYWHATGYGYDVDQFPENQEHFGMVTAEAMSAGVVPVVYDSAGQKEVVVDKQNGFLWTTLDELLSKTNQLIDDSKMYGKLSKAAQDRARSFDRQAFLKRIDQIILELTYAE